MILSTSNGVGMEITTSNDCKGTRCDRMLLATVLNELVMKGMSLAIRKGGGCLGKTDMVWGLSSTSDSTYNLNHY